MSLGVVSHRTGRLRVHRRKHGESAMPLFSHPVGRSRDSELSVLHVPEGSTTSRRSLLAGDDGIESENATTAHCDSFARLLSQIGYGRHVLACIVPRDSDYE